MNPQIEVTGDYGWYNGAVDVPADIDAVMAQLDKHFVLLTETNDPLFPDLVGAGTYLGDNEYFGQQFDIEMWSWEADDGSIWTTIRVFSRNPEFVKAFLKEIFAAFLSKTENVTANQEIERDMEN